MTMKSVFAALALFFSFGLFSLTLSAQQDPLIRTRVSVTSQPSGATVIVDGRDRGLVNADYIHLSHKGGAELASIFVKSLFKQ